jgi:hypothetical protein
MLLLAASAAFFLAAAVAGADVFGETASGL